VAAGWSLSPIWRRSEPTRLAHQTAGRAARFATRTPTSRSFAPNSLTAATLWVVLQVCWSSDPGTRECQRFFARKRGVEAAKSRAWPLRACWVVGRSFASWQGRAGAGIRQPGGGSLLERNDPCPSGAAWVCVKLASAMQPILPPTPAKPSPAATSLPLPTSPALSVWPQRLASFSRVSRRRFAAPRPCGDALFQLHNIPAQIRNLFLLGLQQLAVLLQPALQQASGQALHHLQQK
jgi:hypothetical protein